MHYPCPNCNSFTCTNHIVNVSPPPWVPIQNPVHTPPGTDPLFAEIARLNVENYRLREENQSLKEMLSKLQKDGTIDQLGRKLPLPGHHEDCEYGQNGWSMCYCEEIDKIKQAEDGWKVCMQDSCGNRQYECLKCHYVTVWVKDQSELAALKHSNMVCLKHECLPKPHRSGLR